MTHRQLELMEVYSVAFICTSALANEPWIRLILLFLALVMGICIVVHTPKDTE